MEGRWMGRNGGGEKKHYIMNDKNKANVDAYRYTLLVLSGDMEVKINGDCDYK